MPTLTHVLAFFKPCLALLLLWSAATAVGPATTDGLARSGGLAADSWWPHPQPQGAVLLVADPRSAPRLLGQTVGLLRGLGFSVRLLDPAAVSAGPAGAGQAAAAAWDQLRRQQPGLPLVLAGHGFGATVATTLADELPSASRPQLLWLLAPGRDGPWPPLAGAAWTDADRPEVALARVDALCIGRIERATRLLLVHGDQDALVPAARTQTLADAAPAATVYRIRSAGHHDLLEGAEARDVLRQLLSGWLRAVRASQRRLAAATAADTHNASP